MPYQSAYIVWHKCQRKAILCFPVSWKWLFFTLQNKIREDAGITISGSEHWLYVINQLVDGLCYLHQKEILHDDIKKDNIVDHSSHGKF